MQITIDTLHDTPEQMRIAASLLLTLSGDCTMEELTPNTATGEQLDQKFSGAPVPTGTTEPRSTLMECAAPPPLPPPAAAPTNNVLPFPPPPPPLATAPASAATAGTSTPSGAQAATPAAAASTAVSAEPLEYDKAGMPWDARIHQKGKSKKRDGTWKLKKGIDQGIVEAVVRELAANRAPAAVPATPAPAAGAVPPPPAFVPPAAPVASPVPLPPAASSAVPVPPPPPVPAAVELPAQSAAAPVPVPTGAAPGGVPVSPFRALIDKITAATTAGKITAVKVAEIVQGCGAPNLMQLNSMAHLIPEVSSRIDAAIAGVL